MSYQFLGQDLHGVADAAKKFFVNQYGAKGFKCEKPINNAMPLRPTWQAKLKAGYLLCVNVQTSAFTPTMYEVVTKGAQVGLPIKLWVAIGPAHNTSADIRQARDSGIGVVQFDDDGNGSEYHRAVPLSLFALKKTDLKKVPKTRREEMKSAESTFLDGDPVQGCQAVCQEMEDVTRKFAAKSYGDGCWKATSHTAKFFESDPWSVLLETMERELDVSSCKKTYGDANFKQLIVQARSFTDWRNKVSHKPKTAQELHDRDGLCRTRFEGSRDVLVDWYNLADQIKIL
jgi:hypothetical protein